MTFRDAATDMSDNALTMSHLELPVGQRVALDWLALLPNLQVLGEGKACATILAATHSVGDLPGLMQVGIKRQWLGLSNLMQARLYLDVCSLKAVVPPPPIYHHICFQLFEGAVERLHLQGSWRSLRS